MTISIIIPNFNGENLLRKNLPNILEAGADEVVVLDDFSSDGSLNVLEELRIKNKQSLPSSEGKELRILVNQKNLGFIPSVNLLFKEASGKIIVLLNNDVYVERDFLKPAVKHFDNPKVFAVNLHEEGEGPAISFWKDGFYGYKRGEESEKAQKSAWASGGSAAYNKKLWQQLGGFDELFAPFYWEDVDIAFRAIKAGYDILWEPASKVKHQHETTIKKTFNERYVRWVQERNQLLFIWKNIHDSKLLKDHSINLLKKLFLKMELGYWISFFWAFSKPILESYPKEAQVLSDLETINYANS